MDLALGVTLKNNLLRWSLALCSLLFSALLCSHPVSSHSPSPIKRKIAMIYKLDSHIYDQMIGSYLSNYFSMPLNHMGYVTYLYNMDKDPLPTINDEYAGVVVFSEGKLSNNEDELYKWYQNLVARKIPLVLLGNLGFTPNMNKLKLFSLDTPSYFHEGKKVKITYQAPMMGFERQPIVRSNEIVPLKLQKGTSLLKVKDSFDMEFDVAAITPWGGYYLSSNILVPSGSEGFYQWTINPFEFLSKALRTENNPIPDVTTENGNRLMMVHIDGDGFANPAEEEGTPFVSKVMFDEFIQPYKIPTTVSIIEGELASNGLQPELTATLEPLARKIFASPYVEAATHTFSHPFIWTYAQANKDKIPNPYALPIKNYKFDIHREIYGSVEYINNKLMPPGKRCMAVLWPGEGDAQEKALQYTYELDLANINPGALVNNFHRSLSRVSTFGIFSGPYFQMFAPIGNDHETFGTDNVFLYSIIQILHALQITDQPRRLKAIDIYTHFYSVAQDGGIKAMHKVYRWALSTPVMNVFVSDFFKKMQDFNQLTITKKNKGWLIKSAGFLREFRISQKQGYPDLVNSRNLVGYSDYNDQRYIHLGPEKETFITLTNHPASRPYLKSSNAWLTHFSHENKTISFSLEGYMPIKMTLANMNSCSLFYKNVIVNPTRVEQSDKSYEFSASKRHDFLIQCEEVA